jgi:GNAT superfamily N-acetyltransferase
MHGVRKASREDVPQLAESLARAFYEDPVFKWLFPVDVRRHGHSRRYFRDRARLLLRQDEVYTVDRAVGAAMWARPGEWRDPPIAALWSLAKLAPRIGRRSLHALGGLHEVEARHPSTPHWYLAVLGTEPARQGEGIGSALLRPVLDDCDRLELPAYLETATERNVSFYSRHGFKVVDELTLPDGPHLWLMWRDPVGRL